jgi:hypothetical protein
MHRSSRHRNRSAFSPNANPNEDWTKISDLAERGVFKTALRNETTVSIPIAST